MPKRKKLWSSISAITFASAGLIGCGQDDIQNGPLASQQINETTVAIATDGEGEGDASIVIDMATNDLAYLTQLGLIRGHLYIGHKLYMAGHLEHARTHMKHPESELYADLIPAFSGRNTVGFGPSLQNLATAINDDFGSEKVDVAYRKLLEDIAISEAAVHQSNQTTAERLRLTAELLRVAGEEYAIAVVNGKMENAHEYQDAMGFTAVARSIVVQLDAKSETQQRAATLIDGLNPLWPGLIPPLSIDKDAGEIYGVAAKIELLALSL